MAAESTGSRTKRGLDGALRELLRQKPLAQIRIRELAELCGIRRQSFYYHFTDVYDLFDWSAGQERQALALRQERCLTWRQALEDLLRHTAENRAYFQALMESRGREGLRQVLEPAMSLLVEKTVLYYQLRCGGPPDPAARKQTADCYATLLTTLLESWVCGDFPQPPEELLAVLEGSVRRGVCGAVWQGLSGTWTPGL